MSKQKNTQYAVINHVNNTYQTHMYPSEARKFVESFDYSVLTMKEFYDKGYLNNPKYKKVVL